MVPCCVASHFIVQQATNDATTLMSVQNYVAAKHFKKQQQHKMHLLYKINYPQWRLCFVLILLNPWIGQYDVVVSFLPAFLNLFSHTFFYSVNCLFFFVNFKFTCRRASLHMTQSCTSRCCCSVAQGGFIVGDGDGDEECNKEGEKILAKNILQKWNVLTVWVSARRLLKLFCCRQFQHHILFNTLHWLGSIQFNSAVFFLSCINAITPIRAVVKVFFVHHVLSPLLFGFIECNYYWLYYHFEALKTKALSVSRRHCAIFCRDLKDPNKFSPQAFLTVVIIFSIFWRHYSFNCMRLIISWGSNLSKDENKNEEILLKNINHASGLSVLFC